MNARTTVSGPGADDPVQPGSVDLRGLWSDIVAARVLVLAIVAAFLAAGVAYAFLGVKWYRAEVLLAPQKDDSRGRLMGQFGGLASLAGINLGEKEGMEPLAVLKSREFAREFIADEQLLTVLLADDWDAAGGTWKGPKSKWPDERDAVKVFIEDVRQVVEDKKTGLVTVAVEWTDSATAARWAGLLVDRLNAQMRAIAMTEAEANIKYLRAEIAATNLVVLQQGTARLLEMELQKLMLARGKVQYAFQVIDPAQVPKKPIRPQKIVVIPLSLLFGLLAAVLVVAVRRSLRAPRAN